MAESLQSDRIQFEKMSEQIQFLESAKTKIRYSAKEMASFLGVHPRTLRDWLKGVRSMSYLSAKALSSKTGIKIPANAKIIQWNEHLKKIAKLGGIASYAKEGSFGDPEKRKMAWKKWWKKDGQFQSRDILLPKDIFLPQKNEKLAEFVGIMMGDGGVSKYHISITLNSKTDKEYSIFVCKLIKSLFRTTPTKHKRKDSLAMDIVVNRTKLSIFCKNIGLKVGNKLKQGLDIPNWIKENEDYKKACVRGLIDTDGSFYKHSYMVKGKRYDYIKIGFSSRSPQLIDSVQKILEKLCINAKINYNSSEVKIESQKGVRQYLRIIGTNNPKHRAKIKKDK
jgi:intein/homing endonuclease